MFKTNMHIFYLFQIIMDLMAAWEKPRSPSPPYNPEKEENTGPVISRLLESIV